MQADINAKPESVVSSGYDLVKSEEETDDEDMCKDTNTSSSHQNHLLPINIKQEAVKVEVKAEDDVSTDDEQYSPEYVVSSSGYDPVKSEETDDEDTEEDTNTSNEQHLSIKVKTEDDNKIEEPERRRKSTRLLANSTTHSNASIQDNIDMLHITKKRRYSSKRKREVEERIGSTQKTARIECSVEGCNRKAADSGTCMKKHKGYKHCSQDGCTKHIQKGGVCVKHGAIKKPKTCSHGGCTNHVVNEGVCIKHGAKVKTCSHDGCTNTAQIRGVCVKHGAKRYMKTCSHEGCTNQVINSGVCIKHGAKVKTCSHDGCKSRARGREGVCVKHGAKS